jgi:hypothetical protein
MSFIGEASFKYACVCGRDISRPYTVQLAWLSSQNARFERCQIKL